MSDKIFLDSGAHSLYIQHVLDNKKIDKYTFFETDAFWKYVDNYALLIKKNIKNLELYANVDVIRNPEITWKVQKYLEEEHNLNPLPVLHVGTSLKWLKKYIDSYEYVGIGGLGQNTSVQAYIPFADSVFNLVCDSKGMPQTKIHGFAVTTTKLMFRYPWYSVDSATWIRVSRMGMIIIPKIRYGKTRWDLQPIRIQVSDHGPQKQDADSHIDIMSGNERARVLQIIEEKGFKLGKSIKEKDGTMTVIESGLINSYKMRDLFNMQYMQELQSLIPEWPWAFKHKRAEFL